MEKIVIGRLSISFVEKEDDYSSKETFLQSFSFGYTFKTEEEFDHVINGLNGTPIEEGIKRFCDLTDNTLKKE